MTYPTINDPVSWDTFADYIFDSGWFDEMRPKTTNAVRHFHQKVPAHVLNTLLDEIPERIVVFAPMPAKNGEVMPMIKFRYPTVMVYLSPELERRPQKYVNTTVAHEFAHVFLGHYKPDHPARTSTGWTGEYRDQPSEKEVHELLVEWGFEKPRRKKKSR